MTIQTYTMGIMIDRVRDYFNPEKRLQRQRNELVTDAIAITMILTESFVQVNTHLTLPATRKANYLATRQTLRKIWGSPLIQDSLTSKIEAGKKFAGVEIMGEKWFLSQDVQMDPDSHIYLNENDLRDIYFVCGGKKKKADKLFGSTIKEPLK